jgi:hypothetical protein
MTAQEEEQLRKAVIRFAQVEKELQGTPEMTRLKDELHLCQPFIGSLIMDYEEDFPEEDAETIWKLYMMIWLYFKEDKIVQQVKITPNLYVLLENAIVDELGPLWGADLETRQKITHDYIQRQQSKGLFIFLIYLFMDSPLLERLNWETHEALLIGCKATIECFDVLIGRNFNFS